MEVTLTYGDFTLEALKESIHGSSYENVVSLDLTGNNITGDQCKELVTKYISKMKNLEMLDLKDNKIGPNGAVFLFEALPQYCPKLHYLDINENAIQDEAMYSLALLLQQMAISTLNVVTNHITPRGLPTLCDGINSSHTIMEVSLAFNLLGDEGAAIVAELLHAHPTLRILDISDNRISDNGAIAIAANFILSKDCNIEKLNLSVNQIGDVGFQAIAEALTKNGNKHLSQIDLGCNDAVGDVGRAALAKSALKMKYIKTIDLTSCNLSDSDVLHFISAVESRGSSLESIEWFNNPRISLEVEKKLFTVLSEGEGKEVIPSGGIPSSALIVVGLSATLFALVLYKVKRSP